MIIEGSISYADLLETLAVSTIPELLNRKGEPAQPGDTIELGRVDVAADEAFGALVERGYLDDYGTPPPRAQDLPPRAQDLEDWIQALLAADLVTAQALAPRVFADETSLALCDRLLAPARRAA